MARPLQASAPCLRHPRGRSPDVAMRFQHVRGAYPGRSPRSATRLTADGAALHGVPAIASLLGERIGRFTLTERAPIDPISPGACTSRIAHVSPIPRCDEVVEAAAVPAPRAFPFPSATGHGDPRGGRPARPGTSPGVAGADASPRSTPFVPRMVTVSPRASVERTLPLARPSSRRSLPNVRGASASPNRVQPFVGLSLRWSVWPPCCPRPRAGRRPRAPPDTANAPAPVTAAAVALRAETQRDVASLLLGLDGAAPGRACPTASPSPARGLPRAGRADVRAPSCGRGDPPDRSLHLLEELDAVLACIAATP